MAKKEKTVSTTQEHEIYYHIEKVVFQNCTIDKVIVQTGKPPGTDPPPGTGDE